MSDAFSIKIITAHARKFLETVWPDWQEKRYQQYKNQRPVIASESTCGRSSLFLQRVFRANDIAAEVRFGWFHISAVACAERHTWLQCGTSIVDITADQFGADEIIITDIADTRYKTGIDVACRESQMRRTQTVSEIWNLWLNSLMFSELNAYKNEQTMLFQAVPA